MNMRKFCITGVSGTGKSSVIKELKERGIKAFDVDDMEGICHWKNEESGERVDYFPGIGKEWLTKNSYFADIEKIEEIINENEGTVVMAGLVTNQDEFLKLFDKIFLFQCDKEIFLHRLNTRDSNYFARDKSEQDFILGYYKEFEADMLMQGAIPINTGAPLSEIVDKIILEIQ